jgi:hypothetical protein
MTNHRLNVIQAGFHAKLSPSGAERWMTCTGSVEAEAEYPDQSTEFAAEGTAAHELASDCLIKDWWPTGCIGRVYTVHEADGKVYTFAVGHEMADAVVRYITFIRETAAALTDVKIMVEKRVYYESLVHEGSGTADCIIIGRDEEGRLVVHVIDLKYGKGVPVSATENAQAQLYALAVIETYDWMFDQEPDVIRVTIHQPRLGPPSTWETTMPSLTEFGQRVKSAADRIRSGDVEFVPSEKACKFCRHRRRCAARAKFLMNAIKLEFADD